MLWVANCIEVMIAWNRDGWFGDEAESDDAVESVFDSLESFRFFASSLTSFPNFVPTGFLAFLEDALAISDIDAPENIPYSNKILGQAILDALPDC